MLAASIRFVNLGIEIESLPKTFNLFGLEVAFYGLIIAIGMFIAMMLAFHEAKVTGQDVDMYYDFAIWLIVCSVAGARLYYVIFQWDQYKDNLLEIFNLRSGGLAIYGGILTGIITAIIYAKVKKQNFWQLADVAIVSVLVGQMIGRWGNFFNREAYGGYSDGLFAMQIRLDEAGGVVTEELLSHLTVVDGISYIQVHPTFLYESLWNLGLFILILIFRRRKKFEGEVFAWYAIGYGIGRFIIESLRTDQLLLPIINIPVSQVVSIGMILAGIIIEILGRKNKLYKTPDSTDQVEE
jgi:phosphatidylglycerol:prolipoprotein diacylglycerol transferase